MRFYTNSHQYYCVIVLHTKMQPEISLSRIPDILALNRQA